MNLSLDQTLRLRLRSQGLHPDHAGTEVAPAVRHVVGVQAQDESAAPLQLRARTTGLTASDVEHARIEDHSIVRTWAMRGTLHLIAADDLGWLLGLLGPHFIAKGERRYQQLGLTKPIREKSLTAIRHALREGPLTRAALAERLARKFPVEGQAIAHLVGHAALSGLIVAGPQQGGKPTYVLLDDWAETGPELPRDEALVTLARRYLNAYAPAAPADLAAWSGLGLRECRASFDALSGESIKITAAGEQAWILKDQANWLDSAPPDRHIVKLLGAFDTYLLGYRRRDAIVPPDFARRVNAGGGMIRPTLLVDGRIVATWQTTRTRRGITVTVSPFAALAPAIRDTLHSEVQDLSRFLGEDAAPDLGG